MPGLDPGISLHVTYLAQSYLIPGSSPGMTPLAGHHLAPPPSMTMVWPVM
jgi:hypothetical protein